MSWLDGKKAYIGFILGGILGFAYSMGWISDEAANALEPLVIALCGVGLAHKAAKIEKGLSNKGE